jgi:uncharacterized protein (DUF433 family)
MSIPAQQTIDLSKYIETERMEERPHIRGLRLTVAMIVYSARGNNWDVAETAYQFSLSEAQVLAAMLYYQENKEEIDRQEIEEQAKFDKMKKLHGAE